MDSKEWFSQNSLVHRMLLLQLIITATVFRDSFWRDVVLYSGIVLLAIHLEFQHAVMQHFIAGIKRGHPREPDAPGATPRAPQIDN